MATKKSGSSRKAARNPWADDKSAGVRTSPPRALADSGGVGTETGPGDPPIIIQGGGSIHMRLPKKFEPDGEDPQERKFKNGTQDLISVTIGNTKYDVAANEKIVIKYGTRDGGGGGRPSPKQSS